mmetsp:Transcript_8498/g.31775  ORF Transcript_8498/g.31775 Transcript_8498/m.31775 type:complete len:241 (-) Transcript_8498:101-823(-)
MGPFSDFDSESDVESSDDSPHTASSSTNALCTYSLLVLASSCRCIPPTATRTTSTPPSSTFSFKQAFVPSANTASGMHKGCRFSRADGRTTVAPCAWSTLSKARISSGATVRDATECKYAPCTSPVVRSSASASKEEASPFEANAGDAIFRRRFAAGDLLTRSKDRVTVRARASAVPNLDRRPGGLPGIRVEVTHDVAIAALGDMRAAKDCTMSSEGRTGGLPKKHASAVLLMRPAKLGV